MAELTGSEILAKSLKNEGTDILFFLMGGPMLLAETSCIKEGIRPLDVRHEQSAAFMGQAYSRLLQKPGVTAPIVGNASITARSQKEHLIFEGVGAERPAVAKYHRRAAAPSLCSKESLHPWL